MTDHYLYILSGQSYGPIFIETASDLRTRLKEHKSGHLSQDMFRIDQLVYVERYDSAFKADARLKSLRSASREWVDALVMRQNPDWIDLSTRAKVKTKHAA